MLGFSLDWMIFGEEREAIDVHAADLALTSIGTSLIAPPASGEEDTSLTAGRMFVGLYERYVFLLDSLAVGGRSREEVADKLRAEIRATSRPDISREIWLEAMSIVMRQGEKK